MNQQSGSNRRWIGILAAGMFGFMMLYTQVTGHGLGEMPRPYVGPSQSSSVPGQALAPGATSSNPAFVAEAGVALIVGSPEWLTVEFRELNLLNPDERLQTAIFEQHPDCPYAVIGQAGSFRGRVCEAVGGLYRLNADGRDSGMRWSYDEAGHWTILMLEPGERSSEQAA